MKTIAKFLVVGSLLCATFLSIEETCAIEANQGGIFVRAERHDTDAIVAIGGEITLKDIDTNLGMRVETAIVGGSVEDTQGHEQDYLTWESGVKLGYFSDVFFYGEVGVDFGEMILQDRDEDHYYDHDHRHESNHHSHHNDGHSSDYYIRSHNDDHNNDIDGYVGIGLGVNFGHVTLEAFSRYRQIDGEFWKAKNQTFSGVKMALTF